MMHWRLGCRFVRLRRITFGGVLLFALAAGGASAAQHSFELTIEDVTITLVNKQDFHTFAFNGQVPGPLLHVKEGDDVTVKVTNLTALPHTIHWHGVLQRKTWRSDGVQDITQPAIEPGESFTYRFIAEPSGTLWYHCHVNVNEHVAIRGMWGPLIVDPITPTAIEKRVTKDYILMLTDWASKWAHKPGEGGVPGDVFDYFTINGKAHPEEQSLRVKQGDVLRLRLIGTGELIHAIHPHGHISTIAFKDGRPLVAPIEADTVLIGPGERYDLIIEANNPGRWMIHDHVDSHTVNGTKPMGGIMTVIEYDEIPPTDAWYMLKDRKFTPDFYYEESLKKPYGMYENPAFKGKPIQ